MMQANTLSVPNYPASVTEMLQHAAYYFPRERAAAFDRLRNSDASLALRDMAEGGWQRSPKRLLKRCASELKAAGVRVALVDVTSADIATRAFCVMRAVSPDLQPIWYGYGFERSPVERIRNMKPAGDKPAIHPIW
jgi:hypothetical protein